MMNIDPDYSSKTPFHWAMNMEDNRPSPTACGNTCHPMDALWHGSSIRSYHDPKLLCHKCLQIAEYYKVEHWTDIPDQPTQATKQLSLSSSSNSDISPPSDLSRPFTPEEFLAWLRWSETHGELSLGEIITEAEYMFGFRDARPTLAR